MRITLAPQHTEVLVNQPEDGMGYHRVDITFSDGREAHNVLVFNGEECHLSEAYENVRIVRVTHRDQS
jgi:hypothetical protein